MSVMTLGPRLPMAFRDRSRESLSHSQENVCSLARMAAGGARKPRASTRVRFHRGTDTLRAVSAPPCAQGVIGPDMVPEEHGEETRGLLVRGEMCKEE